MILIVDDTIKTTDGGDRLLSIKSNKTLMGKDKNAKIYGGISISKEMNVIVYNLNILKEFTQIMVLQTALI